jgi:3-isopropylmalate dehydrogenase
VNIVLLPGDGVGPEVVAAGVEVLTAVGTRFGRTFATTTHPIGAAALRAGKRALPSETLDACQKADAVLLGAVGDPAFDHLPRAEKIETGLLALRKGLGVYANLRPAKVFPALHAVLPFKPERVAGADLLIVRELLGGLYFGEPRELASDGSYGLNTMAYTPAEVERVGRYAFEIARARKRKVLSVDKANVLETSQLWRATMTRLGQQYPDVALEHQYVDAFAMNLASDPRRYDVVVTENLFGDIRSDEAGAIAGSRGMLPSASLGDGPGLYEPIHGSAPTLAGKNVANPIGTIGSVALMLRHAFEAEAEAKAVEAAIESALDAGLRTADIALPGEASVSCSAMGKAIAERVAQA